MAEEHYISTSVKAKMAAILPPVFLIILNLFVVGPANIYSGNVSELEIDLLTNLFHSGIFALIIAAILCGIALLLSRSAFHLYTSILLMLGICLWIQGNILVWKYELKGDIDWSGDTYRGIIDSIIWGALIISGIFFGKHIVKKSTAISIIFIVLQFVYLGFLTIQQPGIWTRKEIAAGLVPPQDLFAFSKRQNVIHVVLDELQSTVFRKIIDGDMPFYRSALDGFTFFEETTGCFPTTVMSVPAFLSGETYRNHMPIPDYLREVYEGKTITNTAYDNGFEVDFGVLSKAWYSRGRSTNYYHIPVPYAASLRSHAVYNSLVIQNLVLFRYIPHFLKRYSQIFFSNTDGVSYEVGRHLAHRDFLQDLIEKASLEREKPVYKLFHLVTTHFPVVFDCSCKPVGETLPFNWENIETQAKCSFDHFLKFLEKLKQLGIYDAATIIIHGDHGYYQVQGSKERMNIENPDASETDNNPFRDEMFSQIVASALPTLLIKPPFSTGELQFSTVQASLKDLPDTISRLLNMRDAFGGQSVFDQTPGQVRKRLFNYAQISQQGKAYFKRIYTFEINGMARDRRSWHFSRTLLPPGAYNIEKIDLGGGSDQEFLGEGWARRGGENKKHGVTYRWAIGKAAIVFASLPKDKKIKLSAIMKAEIYNEKLQTVTVKVDGKQLGSWQLQSNMHWETHAMEINPDTDRPDVSSIEFLFSQHQEADRNDKQELAVVFDSISLDPIRDAP